MRTLLTAALLAALCRAQPKTETGDLNGAAFKIDVPEKWNGGLVVYCHGYSPVPVRYTNPKPNPVLGVFLEEGYAVAQSGYAAGGWAAQEALQDTEALRRYFASKYGAPKETWVTGPSFGGFLTAMIMERFPNSYDGGLALCGSISPKEWSMPRGTFDTRVVFDYYFPGALPSPAKSSDFTMGAERTASLRKLLDDKPEAAAALRGFTRIRTNAEVASTISLYTHILNDLNRRAGGNPFDNRNTIYEGAGDDNAANRGVARYAADPRAAEYLRLYTTTGRLVRPMLAIQTTYDPIIPAWGTNMYSTMAGLAGVAELFVQQSIPRDGHCNIPAADVRRGFAELREWKSGGKRPRPGIITSP